MEALMCVSSEHSLSDFMSSGLFCEVDPARKLTFETVDVFTDEGKGGNPLAVVFGAEGCSTETLQRIAREFNYAEIAFVLPPEDPRRPRACIFTPLEEPFAGHPNVAGSTIAAPEPFAAGRTFEPADVAACLGLPADAVDASLHAPLVASVGLPFVFVRLSTLYALRSATPDVAAWRAALAGTNGMVHAYAKVGDNSYRARNFCPLEDAAEDAATGRERGAPGAARDGVEMGRPSSVFAHCDRSKGETTAIRVGGDVVGPVFSGEINLG
ncbi:hypothetical protein JL722_11095 [Aureococcus anophagefferens]|nr:hypothetical protein JL722_11095 [Aureococcus anophagefferens]